MQTYSRILILAQRKRIYTYMHKEYRGWEVYVIKIREHTDKTCTYCVGS